MEKGRLVKVCADRTCEVHFREQQQAEKQQRQWKAQKWAANRKTKGTISFRHRLLADVLKRVKPHFGKEEMRMVAAFTLGSLPHEQACRIAERHGLGNPKDARDWQAAQKSRNALQKADTGGLARLIFETTLIGCVETTNEGKDDDPLSEAAGLFKVDTKPLRAAVAKGVKEETKKKRKTSGGHSKSKAA
jgi:hypothetical protein